MVRFRVRRKKLSLVDIHGEFAVNLEILNTLFGKTDNRERDKNAVLHLIYTLQFERHKKPDLQSRQSSSLEKEQHGRLGSNSSES